MLSEMEPAWKDKCINGYTIVPRIMKKHCPDIRRHIDRLKYMVGGFQILSQWGRFLDEYTKYEFHEPYLKQVRKTIQSEFFKLKTEKITRIRNVCVEQKMTLNWWHDTIDTRSRNVKFQNLNDVFFSITLENDDKTFQRILQQLYEIDSNLWIQTNQSSTSPLTQKIIVYLKYKIPKIANQLELDHFKKKLKKYYNFILIDDAIDSQDDSQEDSNSWDSENECDSFTIDESIDDDQDDDQDGKQNNEAYRNRFYKTWKNDIIYKLEPEPEPNQLGNDLIKKPIENNLIEKPIENECLNDTSMIIHVD